MTNDQLGNHSNILEVLNSLVNLKELSIGGNNFSGTLVLNNLTSLETLYCYNNELITLDISNCLKLEWLDVADNQLTNILFSPDIAELEYLNINYNEKTLTGESLAKIDSKFIKILPWLQTAKFSHQAVNREELGAITRKKANFHGQIIENQFFSTWWNPNCALVINKVWWHAIHLVIYEPEIKKEEKCSECGGKKIIRPRILKVIKLTGDLERLTKEQALIKAEKLKEKLNSDHPILALSSRGGLDWNDLFSKNEVAFSSYDTDSCFQPLDILWRKMEGATGLFAYHVAVYLGEDENNDKKVVHIGSSKFISASKINIKGNKNLMGARVDYLGDFYQENGKFISYHPIIPFKRPEIILKHLTQAVLAEYGKLSELGTNKYDFLGNNCEHFAMLSVCGLKFSTQADWIKKPFIKINPKELADLLAESDKQFTALCSTESFIRETDKIKKYCATRMLKLSNLELSYQNTKEFIRLITKLQQVNQLTQKQAEYTTYIEQSAK